MLSKERINRLKECVRKRQRNMTVILENVHDPHNLGAVLRSCEAVGMTEAYILYTQETTNEEWYVGRNAASGVTKWLKPRFYTNLDECFSAVKKQYKNILATHLRADSQSIYDVDLTNSFAFLFGNEHDGVSEEALSKSDGNIIIPIMGLAESLNVSVASSIALFEAMRQRNNKGMYDAKFDPSNEMMLTEFTEFVKLTKPRVYSKSESMLRSDVEIFCNPVD
jgi:tRNA (guanosine-2'-O-)-methyltransferase